MFWQSKQERNNVTKKEKKIQGMPFQIYFEQLSTQIREKCKGKKKKKEEKSEKEDRERRKEKNVGITTAASWVSWKNRSFWPWHDPFLMKTVLDASSHLYKNVCPSVRMSVRTYIRVSTKIQEKPQKKTAIWAWITCGTHLVTRPGLFPWWMNWIYAYYMLQRRIYGSISI